MELRTATHEPNQTEQRRAATSARGRRPPEDGIILRSTKSVMRKVGTPMLNVWEEYLRDPVAKGLITTGAVLTETGRLIRNYGRSSRRSSESSARRGDGDTQSEKNGDSESGKKVLH